MIKLKLSEKSVTILILTLVALPAIIGLFVVSSDAGVTGFAHKPTHIRPQPINLPPKLPVLCPTQVTCSPGQLIGDIDNDGKFSKIDSTYENCLALGTTQLPIDLCCVDIPPNPDGQVNIFDVQRVINLVRKQIHLGNCQQQTAPQPSTGLVTSIPVVSALKSVVQGDYLYVLNAAGFYIFDITNPAQPQQTAFFDYKQYSSGFNIDFDVIENQVFITNTNDGIVTVDVSDKTNPTLVRNQFGAGSNGIKTYNDNVFAAADGSMAMQSLQPWGSFVNGLRIFDKSPYGILISTFDNGVFCSNKIFASNNRVLLGTYVCGFIVQPGPLNPVPPDLTLLDITNIANPLAISSFSTSGNSFSLNGQPKEIYIKKNMGYVIQNEQLLIFDLSASDPLKLMSSYDAQNPEYLEKSVKVTTDRNNKRVALVLKTLDPVYGRTPLAQSLPGGLDIVDLTNPTNPLFIKEYEIRNSLSSWKSLFHVEIKGDYAYISDAMGFLHVVKWQ